MFPYPVLEEERERREILKRNGEKAVSEVDTLRNEMEMIIQFLDVFNSPEYPYCIELEWDMTVYGRKGKGDLVFSNQCPSASKSQIFISTISPSNQPSYEIKVLIIEAKFIAGTSQRNLKRNFVRDQILDYMHGWKEMHPKHHVRGMILTNDSFCCNSSTRMDLSSNIDLFISPIFALNDFYSTETNFESINIKPYEPPPPLPKTIGLPLIPEMWAVNQRPAVDETLWKYIKNSEFERAHYTCEFCECSFDPETTLTLHQRWDYKVKDVLFRRPQAGVVKFIGFSVLCMNCHELMHMGRATQCGRNEIAYQHLLNTKIRLDTENNSVERVNVLTYAEFGEVMIQHQELQRNSKSVTWIFDLNNAYKMPIIAEWLSRPDKLDGCPKVDGISARRSLGRFLNICCYGSCNPSHSVYRQPRGENNCMKVVPAVAESKL